MAFFNLTHLGVQDPIKASLKPCPQTTSTKNDLVKSELKTINDQQALSTTTATTTTEAQGSYVKYTERLTKHQRTKYGPNEIYAKPVASSHDYGWWKQDGAPENLPWTQIQKYPRVNSEMTRFVDEMTLTNKHFTLF